MSKLPARIEIEPKYRWRLEDMYSEDSIWEEDFTRISGALPEIAFYQGRLAQSARQLLDCYQKLEQVSTSMEKLYVYARMRKDEDNDVSRYQAMQDRAESLFVQFSASCSYIESELIAAGEEKLKRFMEELPALEQYRFVFHELFRLKEHVLSEQEEKLLALSSEASSTGHDAFTLLNNADIRFPVISDEDGRRVELTKGRYSTFLESTDRSVRRTAFRKLYDSYGKVRNTLSACLAGNVKSNRFYTVARKYENCLSAALAGDNVPVSVYDNLIDTIHSNLDKLERYLDLRKKVLKLKTLHPYDLYVPLVDIPKKKYTYEQAVDIICEAFRPLGKEYCDIVRKGCTEDGWVDVYENQGKTSGAYSWGCYLSHPYILLNWQGATDDVFTLAHEVGHAMHTYYSNKNQPYTYAEYKIFVAEVASTVNENLLLEYLLTQAKNQKERAYLLNHYLEEVRGTIYRQVMFAEFERDIHRLQENGGSLTCETLCDMYYELNRTYFGKQVTLDREIAMEWGRIPHFYTSFYVYKYATGFSSAVSLAAGILSGDASRLERYLRFLKSGGSDYPMELLRLAGVDLSDPAPIQDALDQFSAKLELFESLL